VNRHLSRDRSLAQTRVIPLHENDGRFEGAWGPRIEVQWSDIKAPRIGKSERIKNKRASGRPQDLQDLLDLQALGE
jgi:hypothetical protein